MEIEFAANLPPALSRPDSGKTMVSSLEDGDTDNSSVTSTSYYMKPFPLFNDNLGATQAVNNPDTSWRTRHLDVKYFKTRNYIKEMGLTVLHVPMHLHVADFFTKALPYPQFSK